MNHSSPKLHWIPSVNAGRLAISVRPRGGDWLEDEVAGWRKQGVDVVVSLLTPSENEELDLKQEGTFSQAKGIRFISFPIEDRGVPPFSSNVEKLVEDLGSEIKRGKSVAVHCRQGIGRSPLISAALLISLGEDNGNAVRKISQARGLEVPETVEQRRWLDQFAKLHALAGPDDRGR
jgi:protein-tyrosine phosphatase